MIDVSGPLQLAIKAALKADPAVQNAVGGAPKVYDIPPVNAAPPYVVIGEDDILPIFADGFALAELDATVHVWSLPSLPGLGEAKAIGAAVGAALLAMAGTATAGARVYDAQPIRTRYLTDLDGRTAHGVITVRFTTSPA